jgi:hypothetical protein
MGRSRISGASGPRIQPSRFSGNYGNSGTARAQECASVFTKKAAESAVCGRLLLWLWQEGHSAFFSGHSLFSVRFCDSVLFRFFWLFVLQTRGRASDATLPLDLDTRRYKKRNLELKAAPSVPSCFLTEQVESAYGVGSVPVWAYVRVNDIEHLRK